MAGLSIRNDALFNGLRGLDPNLNPRQIVFLNPADAKDQANLGDRASKLRTGQFYDPWGKNYIIRIDGDYDNQIANPLRTNGGRRFPLRQGVIAWSLGNDASWRSGQKHRRVQFKLDDVISWQ